MTVYPYDRAVRDCRVQVDEQRFELQARRNQEISLREHLEELGARNDELERRLAAAEHARVESHLAFVGLLAHARAAVRAAQDGQMCPGRYLEGYLAEVGLLPPEGVSASRLAAEGLALIEDLYPAPAKDVTGATRATGAVAS